MVALDGLLVTRSRCVLDLQVAANGGGKRSFWGSRSGGLSTSWILTVWSHCQSKSVTRATGETRRFTSKRNGRCDAQRCRRSSSSNGSTLFSSPLVRSCRLAPLIQCDYCPLLFHMDCLDPPLTALPAGKWMCPNHVEHLVVRVLRPACCWVVNTLPGTNV